MNKQEALKKLEITRQRIELADEFCQKIEPLLPEGWTTDFIQGWDDGKGILQIYGDDGSVNNFKLICSLVAQITGKKVKRQPMTNGTELVCFNGMGYYKELSIHIDQFNTSSCKVEYEEVTRKICRISDICLQTINEG